MLDDDAFRQVLNHLDRPWAGYRKIRKGVKKRVRRHMMALGCTTIDAYLYAIDRDPAARAECVERLRVTISRFFRDRQLWEQLRQRLLPTLAARFPIELNAWSAGCANGEEAYSLSMVWEDLTAGIAPFPVLQILATDADMTGLHRAREGLYPISSLKEVPEHLRNRWFQKAPGTAQWRVDNRLQERICWQPHQLLESPPPGLFHLILLRNNLLTYYQGTRLKTAFERILAVLADGGILIVGSHEHLPPSQVPLKRDPLCPWVFGTAEYG